MTRISGALNLKFWHNLCTVSSMLHIGTDIDLIELGIQHKRSFFFGGWYQTFPPTFWTEVAAWMVSFPGSALRFSIRRPHCQPLLKHGWRGKRKKSRPGNLEVGKAWLAGHNSDVTETIENIWEILVFATSSDLSSRGLSPKRCHGKPWGVLFGDGLSRFGLRFMGLPSPKLIFLTLKILKAFLVGGTTINP